MDWEESGFDEDARGIDVQERLIPKAPLSSDQKTKYDPVESIEKKFASAAARDEFDEGMGFAKYRGSDPRLGWLVNMQPTIVNDGSCPTGRAGVDLYFLEDDGTGFKVNVLYDPYFYVICKSGSESTVEEYLKKRFVKQLIKVEKVMKEDLSLPNHLSGNKLTLLKMTFFNIQQLIAAKRVLDPIVSRNRARARLESLDDLGIESNAIDSVGPGTSSKNFKEAAEFIVGLREADVTYYCRVCIDCDLRVGLWFSVQVLQGQTHLTPQPDLVHRADPVIFAFDIETSKSPLKFPDAETDMIMMISYMIDGQGYLITNREIVSKDIEDFEYTPKPEYEGPFTIFNEENERAVLLRFFEHIQLARPSVFVTYNGDFFDWPFIETRSKFHGFDMEKEIGVKREIGGEFKSHLASHLDCFYWVKRDSYLPQGSQSLKAVATYKLGYNPMELDPEDMTRFAAEQPQTLAQYSVSDAVATYYLYMKYVHPFIFSLCNIIPMNPDDVLRRGSGTLCEHLLMVQAYKASVVMPNKHSDAGGKFFEGHLLDSETYVGGHVEALEAGVFRSDLPTRFKISSEACQQLIDEVDAALKFSITVEGKLSMDDVVNYDEVREAIVSRLADMRDTPNRLEKPLIYHLDVAAMYPNIILSNRLQPDAVIDETACASCDYNQGVDTICQRRMEWSWRGEFFPSKRGEVTMMRNQLEQEKFPPKLPNQQPRKFHELPPSEQNVHLKKRVSQYSRKVYGKIHETKIVNKEAIVCQRENPFYVNTVRDFRDRRYEYKGLLKTWKKKLDTNMSANDVTGVDEAKKMIVIYDSLQLAHKCILNSFYGYVMRSGARWYSMEMAGIVCLTGARIIQLARSRVEKIGRPLELDTDGIWCILPSTFPENFGLKLRNGKTFPISYPCSMLNHLVHDTFTNHQYHEIDPKTNEVVIRSENSIFFEVDGPYRAMILPASTEEDRLLKKRYAVFNDDGTMAELKGFELKRRGELKLVKNFQSSIFKVFLDGSTLEECYAAVANVSNRWLDILTTKAAQMADKELFDLISENRSMSKSLVEYGEQKSTSITTAKRLAEFLGDQMVKDRGLNCKFVISAKPAGLPVSERAIPVVIFQAEAPIRLHYLRKWLKNPSLRDVDIRDILDWDYYTDRFASVIQKLITIPAAMQSVRNPIPRVPHPDWLHKRISQMDDKVKQSRITESFRKIEAVDGHVTVNPFLEEESRNPDNQRIEKRAADAIQDIEDSPRVLPNGKRRLGMKLVARISKRAKKSTRGVSRDLTENQMLPYVDYEQWLQRQKRDWEHRRIERLSSQFGQLTSSRTSLNKRFAANQTLGVTQFIQRQARSVITDSWHVLQVVETDIPGEFRLWVLIGNNMHSIRLHVPRVFYMNSRIADPQEDSLPPGIEMTKCSRILPRSHPCLHLYEMTMSELFYRENASTFATIFNQREIEGVYETQVTLLFRALIHLGCMVGVGRDRIPQARLDSRFGLFDLERKPTSEISTYLRTSLGLQYAFLFHAFTGSRHVFGCFFTAEPVNSVLVIVDSVRNPDLATMPNLSRVYTELFGTFQERIPEDGPIQYKESIQVDSSFARTEQEALKILNGKIQTYQNQKKGATLFIVQSKKSAKYLQTSGLDVLNDFPVISVSSQHKDNAFPAFGWQTYASKRMVAHFFNASSFVKDRMELARYADVPICNIEKDYSIFLADLTLARRLKKSDMVLWYSESSKPDLGGCEQDDNRFELDELSNPELNQPGSYTTACIEIEIWDLALNTFIQSSLLNEFEGSVGSVVEGAMTLLDPTAMTSHRELQNGTSDGHDTMSPAFASADYSQLSHQTFSIVKAMVKTWTEQVVQKNRFAPFLLEHLYRWITSSSSGMYDPAIYSMIHSLMKRLFSQLLAEFRRLGAKIIYASFDKLVIGTTKSNLKSAVGYIHYILTAVSKNKLFAHVELKPVKFWEYILWMDAHNYGGLQWETPTSLEAIEWDSVGNIDMEWNIASFLPPGVQSHFIGIVALFIRGIEQYRHAQLEENRTQALQDQGKSISMDLDKLGEYLSKLLNEKLTRRLLSIVENIQHKKVDQSIQLDPNVEPFAFPELPGSYLNMTNAALEFIKSVIAVFTLESRIEKSVRNLRKNLLVFINVPDFSDEANFVNPCEEFKLSHVICEYCNFCRDLDLTREGDYSADFYHDGEDKNDSFWSCSACETEYRKENIEQRLIDIVQRRLSVWQLQDLKCKKCRLIKAEELREQCASCTGTMVLTLKRDDFLRRMKIFRNLARFHKLHMLEEIVETISPRL